MVLWGYGRVLCSNPAGLFNVNGDGSAEANLPGSEFFVGGVVQCGVKFVGGSYCGGDGQFLVDLCGSIVHFFGTEGASRKNVVASLLVVGAVFVVLWIVAIVLVVFWQSFA